MTLVVASEKKSLFSRFFKVDLHSFQIQQFNGDISPVTHREVLERGEAVCVLPYDPVTNTVVLIEQFLVGSWLAGQNERPLQVIAGMVDKDLTHEDIARAEAFEEAGCIIEDLIEGPKFLPSPGGCSEFVHGYLAITDLSGYVGGLFGLDTEGEDIRALKMDADEAIARLDNGEIIAGPAVVLLSWFARHKHKFSMKT